MKQQIGCVMACRIQFEHLEIQFVRQPGHGMPVGLMEGCERPLYAVRVQSVPDVRIVRYVAVVVVVDEGVMDDGVIKREGHNREENAEKDWTHPRRTKHRL